MSDIAQVATLEVVLFKEGFQRLEEGKVVVLVF